MDSTPASSEGRTAIHIETQNERRHSSIETISHLNSRNFAVATSAVVEGIPDEQKTSPVRRVYCLLCLFDLICIFIIWVIYTRLVADANMGESFRNQIVRYTLSDSMFDLILLALVRVSIQEIAYGILRARKPWWTAVSTSITCGFLLLKIFYYGFKTRNYNKGSSSAMDYILMLASFVFCWVETWFLDFRVLPKEKAARQLTENTALLDDELRSQSFYQGLRDDEQFFSPRSGATPRRSRFSTARHTTYHSMGGSPDRQHDSNCPDTADIELILLKASEAFDAGCSLFSDGGEWTHEKGDAIQGCVYSRKISRTVKIWKLEMLCSISPRRLYEDFVLDCHKSPEWNETVVEMRNIHRLNENTDVIYSVTAEQLRGAVTQRDFVVVRRWSQISPRLFLIASQSVEHPSCPRYRQYIRGHNGVGILVFENVTESNEQCKFTWVINTNLKGWLPQTLVDQASVYVMFNTLTFLRNRVEVLTGRA